MWCEHRCRMLMRLLWQLQDGFCLHVYLHHLHANCSGRSTFLIRIILTAAKSPRLCSVKRFGLADRQHPKGNRQVQEVEDAESAWPLAICLVKYGLNCGCAPPPSSSFFQQLSLHASMKRCSISRKCSCQYFLPFSVLLPACLMNKSDFLFLAHLILEANIILFGS